MNIEMYILPDGSLDHSAIISEFNSIIRDKSKDLSSDNKDALNRSVIDFVTKISGELAEIDRTSLIPDLIKITLELAFTSGIENLNLPIQIITDMIDFIEGNSAKRKKQDKKKDKKAAVLDAAMIVFANKGFHQTHVDDIAELAGVAKGTVYRYFDSKEDILKEIIRDNSNRLVAGLSTIFNKDGHILELIKEAIAFYIDFFEGDKELYKILTHAPWILKDISDHFYKSIISHLQIVRKHIFKLTREGVVKPTDFYTVFYGIFGFIDGVMQKWFRRNCEYSLKDELPVIIEVLFNGFVTEEKRKEIYI